MPDMIVIRSPRAVLAPFAGSQQLIYANPRILINLRAEDAAGLYQDGGSVPTLQARGSGRAEERSFGPSTGWGAPILDVDGANGRPALQFNGTQQIANVSGSAYLSQERTAPLTYIAVARVDQFSSNTSARIVGGSGGSGTLRTGNIQPASDGNTRIIFNAGGSNATLDVEELNGWAVHVMVVNGPNGKVKAGRREILTRNVGNDGNRGLHVGGNTSTGGTTGLKGAVAEVIMIDGALSDPDIEIWYDFLARKYGIATSG